MSTSSVQFQSSKEVLEAYLSREVAPWSIFHGKQFQFKFEGEDLEQGAAQLAKHLVALQRSAAVYTLKVYEDLQGKIKSNTPDDGSFNFRLNAYSAATQNSELNEVLTELRTVKLQLEQLQSDDEDDEPENKLGVIGDVLALPGMTEAVQTMMPMLIGKLFGATPQALAGVPGASDGVICNLDQALKILKESDPLFEQHMIQLATVARDKPEKFNSLIGMIGYI